jgi:hypothetical protein
MGSRAKSSVNGLDKAGSALWSSISETWDLDAHEKTLLLELCRITDRLDRLAVIIDRDGEIIKGLHGPKVNPALTEARQQAIAAARIMAALRLPDGDEADLSRGQRRVGFRTPYLVGAS